MNMKVSLPGAFKRLAQRNPEYSAMLEELEGHLRETIRGEHTLQEFAEFYCLTEPAPLTSAHSRDE